MEAGVGKDYPFCKKYMFVVSRRIGEDEEPRRRSKEKPQSFFETR